MKYCIIRNKQSIKLIGKIAEYVLESSLVYSKASSMTFPLHAS